MKRSFISGTLTSTSASMPGPLHDCHSKNQWLVPSVFVAQVHQLWSLSDVLEYLLSKWFESQTTLEWICPHIAFYYFHLCGAVPTPLLLTVPFSAMNHSAEFLTGYFPCQRVYLADIVKMNIDVLVSWPFPAPCIQSWFVFMCIWVGGREVRSEWLFEAWHLHRPHRDF